MSKQTTTKEQQALLAENIWNEIIVLVDQHTHDSPLAKFFLPIEITDHCRPFAASFASNLYTPSPADNELFETHAYYLYFLSMIFGVQLFLKERSFKKNAAPYTVHTQKKIIDTSRERATAMITTKKRLSPLVRSVFTKYLTQFTESKKEDLFMLDKKKFHNEKLEQYLAASVLWGYFFAKQMVVDR